MFDAIKTATSQTIQSFSVLKRKDGSFSEDDSQQLDRRIEHYSELCRTEGTALPELENGTNSPTLAQF